MTIWVVGGYKYIPTSPFNTQELHNNSYKLEQHSQSDKSLPNATIERIKDAHGISYNVDDYETIESSVATLTVNLKHQ
jgi:hypothetical protein